VPTHARSPQFLKGAIVAIDVATSRKSTIVLQYNPESLARTIAPQVLGGEQGQRSQAVRFTGAPVETIQLEVTIDASDQLEAGEAKALDMGIHPQLTALEMLLYPRSQDVVHNQRLLDQGMIEIGPYVAPLTLFIWGGRRVLPVSLTSFSSREELFDGKLNPIRATVSLSMRALSYSDLDPSHQGYHLFLAYQQVKEAMAAQGLAGDPHGAIGVDVSRL
jgi:hypothetical protein